MRYKSSYLLFVTFTVTVWGCVYAWGSDSSVSSESEIKTFLNQFLQSYAKKDISGLMDMIASDGDVVFFDTATDARFVGKQSIQEAYQTDFEQIKSFSGEFTWLSIKSKGEVAWFSTEMLIKADTGQVKFKRSGFWTGVLEKRQNRWQLIMSHFSFGRIDPIN